MQREGGDVSGLVTRKDTKMKPELRSPGGTQPRGPPFGPTVMPTVDSN